MALAPGSPARTTVMSSLSATEKLFSSSADRAMVRAIDSGLDRVEDGILSEISFTSSIADASARYLLDAGGKRVRPMLTLITAQLGEGVTEEALIAAEAIEITHLASLYHDDVMDVASMRRGVPSAHEVYGNSVAILAGDLLFARASALIARLGVKAIQMQVGMFERLCLGQLDETVGPTAGEDAIAHYIRVLGNKTGSLISVAARMGVVYGHAPAEFEGAVGEYGERVGVAFQLIDDVIDLAPASDETGKKAGTDLRAGVATLPLLLLRRLAVDDLDAAALLARIDRGIAGGPEHEDDLDAAIDELYRHPVTAETRSEALRWAQEADEALTPLPNGSIRKALQRFADQVVDRIR